MSSIYPQFIHSTAKPDYILPPFLKFQDFSQNLYAFFKDLSNPI